MKYFLTAVILCTIFECYSQTTAQRQPYSSANLNQYLWSFSKNSSVSGTKHLVDFDVMDNRRALGFYVAVSNDGNYFAYTVNKMAYNQWAFGLYKIDSLVIQSTKTGKRAVFPGIQPGEFTSDSRQYVFRDNDSLCVLELDRMRLQKTGNVASYKITQSNWLAYTTKGEESLVLKNLVTGKKKTISGIRSFQFNGRGDWMVCQQTDKKILLYNLITMQEKTYPAADAYYLSERGDAMLVKSADQGSKTLQYVSLVDADAKCIWTGDEKTSIDNFLFDVLGKGLIFKCVDSTNADNSGILYYERGMETAVLKLSNHTESIAPNFEISDAAFTNNGRYVRLTLQEKPSEYNKQSKDIAGLEVWNHKDLYLQSAQSGATAKSFNAMANIQSGKIVFVEGHDKKLLEVKGDFALVKKDYANEFGDRFWDSKKKDSFWVVSLKEGSTQELGHMSNTYWFSPFANYLVFFDATLGCHYFFHDLRRGVTRDITANLPVNQLGIVTNENTQSTKTGSLAAWIEGKASVLVYDNFDIWKLDLTGKEPATNLTNGFGASTATVLNLFATARNLGDVPVISANDPLILRGFNSETKQQGFYRKETLSSATPTKLFMGNYFMSDIGGCHDPNVLFNNGVAPVKARWAGTWIVQRQSSSDPPNYYATDDFKSFKKLTGYQPLNNYQWFTEELVSFEHLDGSKGQGILYKPENFDPNKKYPVIIPFYGAFSNNMYQYPYPSYIDQAMEVGKSPVWFLNNGYLVFTPDIAVAPGKYGPKAFSVIEGAVQQLRMLPFVDINKIGCASHSWGAKLAAYIFTHSKSITATAITEGLIYGNMINIALSTSENGKSNLADFEASSYQYGNPWDNKDSWLDQTTVLNVDKAVSPLLLLCNKESNPEYQNQTLQFFTALRRLDKNVWWLKYDKGSHTLTDQKELKDYTIRYTQFFDHYLKNAPAPIWMTRGIPYKLKGIESRYELDPEGKCNATNGEPCAICEAWNTQYKRAPRMFDHQIADWSLDDDVIEALERKQKEKRKQLDKEGEEQTKQVLKILTAGN